MNIHDATEAAYKNGFNKAVVEMSERLKSSMYENIEGRKFRLLYEDEIDGIKKEMLNNCTQCKHFVGCESYGRVCGKYEDEK